MKKLKEIVLKQREFFLSGRTRNENFRIKNLKILKKSIDDYKDKLINGLKKDLNKSIFETHMSEIVLIYDELKFFEKNLLDWMKKERAITPILSMPAKSYTIYEPLGVNLIISPWNYPVILTLQPLIAAIGAGNTAIIKVSNKSKYTGEVLKEMINKSFPQEYIYVIDENEISKEELLEEKYDHIFFTGSSFVGKKIMKKASENLTKITLELGGKSPCIVDETADIDLSAKRIMWGKLLNAGQTCVAPDFIIAHKDIKEKLIKKLKYYSIVFFGPNPLDNPDYPKIINKDSFTRLKTLLENENICFGGKSEIEKLKIEPSIVKINGFDNKLMQKEIFGPILPIIEYENIFNIINKLKTLDKPLALYIFSRDQSHIDRVIYDLSYGNACINDTIMQITSKYLEFGGVGNSGLGSYHGKSGFVNFSNKKSIMDRKIGIDTNLRYPPYKKEKSSLLKLIEK